MAGGEGCQGGAVLWERSREATAVDWGQEESRHWPPFSYLFNGNRNVCFA